MVRLLMAGLIGAIMMTASGKGWWPAGMAEEAAVLNTATQYRGRAYRNPFRGLLPVKPEATTAVAEPVAPPALAITGIVWSSKKPTAIIGGKLVGVGDIVNDAQIIGIEPGVVRVRYQNKEFLLEVK